MKILVTGASGFIGFHTAVQLLSQGHEVVGLDSNNDYYDVGLKYGRLAELGIDRESAERWSGRPVSEASGASPSARPSADSSPAGGSATAAGPAPAAAPAGAIQPAQSSRYPGFRFVRMQLEDAAGLLQLFADEGFDRVCHLAAQAGVRYSLENPQAYISSNIQGFLNILEACRQHPVQHLVYASSSSVYGSNEKMPFSTSDNVDHPVSLYAASKKSNELMAHTYSHLYGIPATGLRFFTVYGPWGRPDMAPMLFSDAITAGRAIKVFNNGDMQRDFTYVDDIVAGVVRVLDGAPGAGAGSQAPHRVYNIGRGAPVKLMEFIAVLERCLGREAQKNYLPMQPGDVPATWADVSDLERDHDYRPATTVEDGVASFVAWYREFYGC
ncbi:NAD-dependent epimerase [Spirochaeta africana]|uniref:Nucleoside-diphosphate-sugar epimerase n=1 Tax=Spirochaeta africana (strain ATCC 700263 / DSM 8902 / Z-7692) TaxID=889378 RepID=H9UF77_SPIAZ|nr:NAD-dependent epimerase [Spirochaeta africana]AFG36170.1 nucleoside-diphosphate-sugar epimerase [Spirochaeta africana DSM 8902]